MILWEDFLDSGRDVDLDFEDLPPSRIDDVMIIFWSSGTTGKPKGIQHTNKLLMNSLQKMPFPPGATTLQSTCFFHIGGFFLPVTAGLFNKLKTTFLNPNRGIKPEVILKECNEVKSCLDYN